MSILAAAPAAAPEVPLIAIGVGVIAFYLVMLGLKGGYDYSLGAVLRQLARVLDFKVWRFHVDLGKGIEIVDHHIESTLASGLGAAETAVGKWWYAQKSVAMLVYDSVAWLATSTLEGFENLVGGTIPHIAISVSRPAIQKVGGLTRALRAEVARLENQLVRKANALARQLEQDFGRAWRGIDHIQHVSLRNVWKGIHGVEADVRGLEHSVGRVIPHRLTRLEKWLGAGVIGGAAIAALTRVFPYWQCSNVKRFNRMVCRSPFNALEDLFGLALLAVGPLSIVEFAHELQAIMEPVEDGITYFVHE